jgi:hypothetical protein
MDYICSLTGKSPSTTGAGSEGALTKGPFNALSATSDLNTALVSMILCDYAGFSTSAGFIGSQRRIDHDISLLIPELWSRLTVEERDPRYLIEQGHLEKMEDFEHQGRTVFASRLGYRITERFVHTNFGKIFDYPTAVFDEAMLKPETQDLDAFIDGIDNIYEAQKRVAQLYIEDGTVEDACPPLKALIYIMAEGQYEGKTIDDPAIRDMFTRDYLLASDWYQERLEIKQQRDLQLWQRHYDYIKLRLGEIEPGDSVIQEKLTEKLNKAERIIATLSDSNYTQTLIGTLGTDWVHRKALNG